MARRNNPKQKGLKNKMSPSVLYWWPIIVCIKIGDFVRHIFSFAVRMVLIFADLVVRTFRKGWNDIHRVCLSSLRFKRREARARGKRGRPSKKRVSRSWRITLPHIRIPELRRVTIRLPSFSLPRYPIAITSFFPHMRSFLFGVAVTVLFFFIPYQGYQILKSLPDPHLLTRRDLEVSTKIFDRNGILLYEIYADQNRTPLTLSEIPQTVINATIAIEDHDFYRHLGFSGRGILRALKETVVNKQIQGGSTITQQLIRSALLTPEISIRRKLKEIFLAFWAERIYSKDQILEMYFNQVPYGGTAWGIEAASQMYFGKSVKELTLSESTLLAGLPAAPSEYSPFGNHPEKAFARQAEVLHLMTEYGYIKSGDEENALSEQIRFVTPRIPIRAAHFVMFVKEILEATYGPRLVERGGLRIITSLDITLQEKVEDIIKSQIESLAALRVGNGAALVTNPKTGEILSMVGSKNYFDLEDEGNVNVVTSLRQPGSSIKVVNYAAALENGFTAATIIDDSPAVYTVTGSKPYSPVNYDGKFHGPTPLRYALANSYNVPAVKVLAKIGVQTMINKGRLMGITSWKDESRYGLSLTLGGGDVTMLDMAKVYGTLANGGRRRELMPILEIADYTGHILEHNTSKKGVQAVTPGVAWILGNILSDNDARAAAFGRGSSLVVPGHTVSVKTGTSNDKRDNWTIGYSPSYVVVIWVGNNNNAPMDPYLTSGITGASPIWHDIMMELLKSKEDEAFPKPSDVVAIPCYFGRMEYFTRGTEPKNGRCAALPVPSPTPAELQE